MTTNASESAALVGSDRVEGKSVYNTSGEKIGSIKRLMIEKISGKVAYAVLGFEGFPGIGDDHYPLPWSSLHYDKTLDGYRADVSATQLERAPKYTNDRDWSWDAHARTVEDFYARPNSGHP